jgi:hypothetical protein
MYRFRGVRFISHRCGTAYKELLIEMLCTGTCGGLVDARGSRAGAIFAGYGDLSSLLHTDHHQSFARGFPGSGLVWCAAFWSSSEETPGAGS